MGPLQDRIAELSPPIEPLPTGETPRLDPIHGLRAVVFDIYGTLLVSGSGDISLASEGSRGGAATEALAAVGVAGCDGERVVELLHAAILEAHREAEMESPEVEIREIWGSVLEEIDVRLEPERIERLAVEYECRVNPIGPMPELGETLEALRGRDLRLGVVSNAQFFTPLAFEPLTGRPLTGGTGFNGEGGCWGFEADLLVWSYEHLVAKPSTALYEMLRDRLEAVGVGPAETLYVGNDLRNDVWPAQLVGFKTALFAGDGRSLRWRRDDERLAAIAPDVVVTRLGQLLEIIG
ncbi:Phosphoglycolate phosphatase [Pseudobythopirellula maris]|uniref:Phosphoglycolate phosphatase n=1 Tax=Pseudobythopirellula maris TaxID=2527991 RepID=A0A5C5ZPK9_9BACT|nr:HAD family hydrolase [Pseudobythopirellula maris]TWT89055.1 Phosphoglycolate phosphatase [Pseudobythopirellula maris]